jgi:hypothetical protein
MPTLFDQKITGPLEEIAIKKKIKIAGIMKITLKKIHRNKSKILFIVPNQVESIL